MTHNRVTTSEWEWDEDRDEYLAYEFDGGVGWRIDYAKQLRENARPEGDS